MANELSHKILNVGFVCALLVVSIHVGLGGPDGCTAWCLKNMTEKDFVRICPHQTGYACEQFAKFVSD